MSICTPSILPEELNNPTTVTPVLHKCWIIRLQPHLCCTILSGLQGPWILLWILSFVFLNQFKHHSHQGKQKTHNREGGKNGRAKRRGRGAKEGKKEKIHSLDDGRGVLGFWISPLSVLSQDETPCGGPEPPPQKKHTRTCTQFFTLAVTASDGVRERPLPISQVWSLGQFLHWSPV